MPRLSCWFTRAALIYLVIGFTLGGLLLWNKGIPFYPQIWRYLPIHIEFQLFGWMIQLIMGVAYWILPRFQTQRRREQWAWLAFFLLNGGCWLVVFASWNATQPLLIFIGRLAEIGAVAAFVIHAWPRIKPPMPL